MKARIPSQSICSLAFVALTAIPTFAQSAEKPVEYLVLATSKTSTMQKEMQEAAAAGFRFGDVAGGRAQIGSEVVVVMHKDGSRPAFDYRLLATKKTSTMQKELQEAGDEGFQFVAQTVFMNTFRGAEVICILEKDLAAPVKRYEYRLLASTKTSTMQKELLEAGGEGFAFVALTMSKSALGGEEMVAILRREAKK